MLEMRKTHLSIQTISFDLTDNGNITYQNFGLQREPT